MHFLSALDEAISTVVKRDLNENERQNYDMFERHLLARFGILKRLDKRD